MSPQLIKTTYMLSSVNMYFLLRKILGWSGLVVQVEWSHTKSCNTAIVLMVCYIVSRDGLSGGGGAQLKLIFSGIFVNVHSGSSWQTSPHKPRPHYR